MVADDSNFRVEDEAVGYSPISNNLPDYNPSHSNDSNLHSHYHEKLKCEHWANSQKMQHNCDVITQSLSNFERIWEFVCFVKQFTPSTTKYNSSTISLKVAFYPPFATVVTVLKENNSFGPKDMATGVQSFQSKWVRATTRAPCSLWCEKVGSYTTERVNVQHIWTCQ
jgi:hypothetical protein